VRLSILCVTKREAHAGPFLQALSGLGRLLGAEVVFACDGAPIDGLPPCDVVLRVTSDGYVESVLPLALAACTGDYILRLDDDERCSPAMVAWLLSGVWQDAPAWKFATAGLWGNADRVLTMPELWPQYHVRLTTARLAGGQTRIHQRHPVTDAEIAPVAIEHHKFLVKSLDERLAIAARYDQIRPGAGKRCHSAPELAYDELLVAPLGDGAVRAWVSEEIESVPMAVRA